MRTGRLAAAALLHAAVAVAATADPLYFGQTPQDAVAADFDGDGRTDFAVANAFDDTVVVLLQQPDGSLAASWSDEAGIVPAHPFNFPRAIEARDWNADGFPDLTVLCSGNFAFAAQPSVQTFLNRGDGTFVALAADPVAATIPNDLFPVHFALGEFTGDTYADIAVAQSRDHSIRILVGNGTGRFVPGAVLALAADAAGPENVLVDDLNADGLHDLLCTSPDGFEIVVQTAPGVFAPPIAVALPVSGVQLRTAAADDFDFDGALDIVLADAAGRAILLSAIAADGTFASHEILSDPALIEPVDAIGVQWDGDGIPDIAVADFSGGGVTIFASAGATERFAAAPRARRLAVGDKTGDRVGDLFVACQGDLLDGGNPDAIVVANPNAPDSDGTVMVDGSMDLGTTAGTRIAGAQALAAANPTRLWTIQPDRDAIREFNPSPNLNSSPQGRVGRVASYGFAFGGVWMTNQNAGFALERDAPRVHAFNANTGLQSVTTLADSPDAYGYTGLARDEDTGDLYASCGATGKLARFSSAGALLASVLVDPPVWDIDWDPDRARLVGVNPGRNDVRFYTSALAEDATLRFDLSGKPTLVAQCGIVGVSKSRNLDDLYLLLDSGLIARREMATGDLKDIITIDPADEGSAVAYNPSNDRLILMGPDGHAVSVSRSNPSQNSVLSFLAAVDADPAFLFGGVTFDTVVSEYLVADARRPICARFSNSGNFQGFVDHSASLPNVCWRGGIARDPVGGQILLRSRFAAHDPAGGAPVPLPAGPSDLALYGNMLVAPVAGLPALMVADPTGATAPAVLPLPPEATLHDGYAFDAAGSLIAFDGAASTGTIDELTVDIPEPSAVPDWSTLDRP